MWLIWTEHKVAWFLPYRNLEHSSTNGAAIEVRPLIWVLIVEKVLLSEYDTVNVTANGQHLQWNNVKLEEVAVRFMDRTSSSHETSDR